MNRITIVGTGLIGSSIGLAIKKAGLEFEIVGTDRDRGVAARAHKAGALDSVKNNPLDAIKGSSIIILATPVGGIQEMMKLFGPSLESGVIVTDTGSTKTDVLKWAKEYLPETVHFIGGHPMAGKEISGPEAAQADLFQGATYCIIPDSNADPQAVESIVQLAESIGSKPFFLDAAEHDSYVATVSHLPLILSTALVTMNTNESSWSEVAKLASTGFRDITRLASGSPVMCLDICLTNKDSIVRRIDEFILELTRFKEMIDRADERELGNVFDQAWEARDRWMQDKITARGTDPVRDLPTTAETMGGMIMGDRAAGKQRQLTDWKKETDRNR